MSRQVRGLKNIKYISVRVEKELHEKFCYVAGAEGRSMSSQVVLLIRKCVREYEKEHGPITEV